MIYFKELSEKIRNKEDRYVVSTIPDPFVSREDSRTPPEISVTTIIDKHGIKMSTEPRSLNRRNRMQTMHQIVTL